MLLNGHNKVCEHWAPCKLNWQHYNFRCPASTRSPRVMRLPWLFYIFTRHSQTRKFWLCHPKPGHRLQQHNVSFTRHVNYSVVSVQKSYSFFSEISQVPVRFSYLQVILH